MTEVEICQPKLRRVRKVWEHFKRDVGVKGEWELLIKELGSSRVDFIGVIGKGKYEKVMKALTEEDDEGKVEDG